jgi:glucose/arabinose dehydrogenase
LGLASNPFYDGDPTANRSKVWAIGLRNPFRLTLGQASELPIVADVGWRAFDEVDVVPAGANFGWPCFEGRTPTQDFRSTAQCAEMYRRGDDLSPPTIELPHGDFSSVTGGVFYTDDVYPDEHRGYYYGDFVDGWIRHAPIDPATGELRGEPLAFGEDAGGPVAFRTGPDGLLYYLALNYAELIRITYEPE